MTPTDRVGVLDCEAARLGGPAGAQGARAESGQRGVIEGATRATISSSRTLRTKTAIFASSCKFQTKSRALGQSYCHPSAAPERSLAPLHRLISTAAGLLTRPSRRTRDPRPLGGQNTYCPGMPSHASLPSYGRRRQEHPVMQSLSHCAWCFPISGAAMQQAGGHGGRTRE